MSTRRRILRLAILLFVILAVAGYGAVSTLLFNPLEGDYDFDVSTLIPRDVEFYVAKADLEGVFDPFPHIGYLDEFEATERGAAVARTELYQNLRARMDLEPIMVHIDEALAQLPVEISPLTLFGGGDAAVAGYFQGANLGASRWAAYGRTNWMGKAAVELLRYPGSIGLSEQGLVVDEVLDGEDRVGHSLTGGQLTMPLYITRVLDVVVVSNTPDLIKKAVQFDAVRGQDSLGMSAKYGDNIDVADRSGDELEVYVHQRKLAENMGWSGQWPDPTSASLFSSLGSKLFQMSFVNEIVGSMSFQSGFSLRLHAPVASDEMTKEQKRLYRTSGFERHRGERVARLAPADAGLFYYMHADIGDLLRAFTGSLGEEPLVLFEDVVREVWGYADASPLIDDLDATFRDQLAVIVRDHDYEEEADGPPHDDTPILSWAVVLWPKDREKLSEIENRIQSRQGALRIQGRDPGSRGVMENRAEGGSKIFEYWNVFVPGTGMIATLNISSDEDYFVISNSHDFLSDINATFFQIERQVPGQALPLPPPPQLAQHPFFQSYVLGGLASRNAVLWLNPRAVEKSLREIANFQSDLDVVTAIDWTTVGPTLRRRLLGENWPNEDPASVSPEVQPQLELLYDSEAERYQREYVNEHGTVLREDYLRRVEAWTAMQCAMLQLAIDPKAIDLLLQVYMPLE